MYTNTNFVLVDKRILAVGFKSSTLNRQYGIKLRWLTPLNICLRQSKKCKLADRQINQKPFNETA